MKDSQNNDILINYNTFPSTKQTNKQRFNILTIYKYQFKQVDDYKNIQYQLTLEMDFKQENPRRIHGLNDAVQLLLQKTKDAYINRSLERPSQLNQSQLQKINKQSNKPEAMDRNRNRLRHVFMNQMDHVQISTRVKQAACAHQRILESLDKRTYNTTYPNTGVNNQVKPNPIPNPQLKQKEKVVQYQVNPFVNNIFTDNQQPVKLKGNNLFSGNNILPIKDIFAVSNTQNAKTNVWLLGQKTQSQNKQKVTFGNDLQFGSNQKHDLFRNKPQNLQRQKVKPESNVFSEPNRNVFEHKIIQEQAKPREDAVSILQGGSPKVYTLKATVNKEKKAQQNQINQSDIKKSQQKNIQTEQVQKQSAKPIPINIFAQGVFQQQDKNKGQKPVLIFNNNLFTKPSSSENNQQKLSSQNKKHGPIKLIFNNNSSTLEPVKAIFNIFGGGSLEDKQPLKEMQIQEPKMVQQPVQNVQNNMFDAPKMQVQQVKPQVNQGLYSQKAAPLSNVIQTPRISLFGNNQQKSVFSSNIQPQPQPKPVFNLQKQVGLFQNNFQTITQQKKVVQASQIQNSRPGLFGIAQSKPQDGGLFSNNNSLFQKKQEPLKSVFSVVTPTGGLFGTPTGAINLFSQQNNIIAKSQPQFVPQAAQKEQQSQNSKEVNIFTKKQQSSQNIFSQNNQKPNLFSTSNQVAGQNVFKKTQNEQKGVSFRQNVPVKPTNPFAKIESQPNMFSNSAPTDTMFKNSTQGNSLFANASQGNSLFSNAGQGNSLFANAGQGNSLFGTGNKQDKKGASLFSKKQNQDDDQQIASGQEDDEQQEAKQQSQENKGQMKFTDYLQTTIYAKVQALKFKLVSTGKLIQNIKISLEKFPDTDGKKDDAVYLIVRNANKTLAYYGVLIPLSELKIISQKQGAISIAIQNLIQVDVQNSNSKSKETWRVQFKESKQAKQFVSECKNIIHALQAKKITNN